jgi:GT2 family glycosyltransferase
VSEVTVVVVTRDRSEQLTTCLSSLLALPDRPEVIVVDNGSSDGTAHLVQRSFPEVRLFALASNHGAVSRNLGVRAASTPYVAFADDDSGWQAGSLLRAVRVMREHPRLAVIAARTLVGDDYRLDPTSWLMSRSPLGTEPDLPGPSVLGFLACSAIVRKDPFLAAGGFDPVVFFMGEESRLAYDLAAGGWGLAYCDDIVAFHSPEGGPSAGKVLLARRNELLTAVMRRPWSVVLGQIIHLERTALHDPISRAALLQAIRRLPAALVRRRPPAEAVERRLRVLALQYRRMSRPPRC